MNNYFQGIATKPIYVQVASTIGIDTFYKKQGFKVIDEKTLELIWEG